MCAAADRGVWLFLADRVLKVEGATSNNLKDVTAEFPLGVFTCVTGVSGSGKSTLVIDTLYKAVARRIAGAAASVRDALRLFGAETALPGPFGDADTLAAIERADKLGLYFRDQTKPAIDQRRIKLDERGARFDLREGRLGVVDAAHAHQRVAVRDAIGM